VNELIEAILRVAAFFGGYLLQAGIVFGAMLVIALVGLPILLAIRQVWRWISPYEEPDDFDYVPGLRDRLERL